MRSCPNPKCQYKSNNARQYQHHLATTGHGGTTTSKKVFKGHNANMFRKGKK